jgi:hypothetical protein
MLRKAHAGLQPSAWSDLAADHPEARRGAEKCQPDEYQDARNLTV